jgi:hypothetical protein
VSGYGKGGGAPGVVKDKNQPEPTTSDRPGFRERLAIYAVVGGVLAVSFYVVTLLFDFYKVLWGHEATYAWNSVWPLRVVLTALPAMCFLDALVTIMFTRVFRRRRR